MKNSLYRSSLLLVLLASSAGWSAELHVSEQSAEHLRGQFSPAPNMTGRAEASPAPGAKPVKLAPLSFDSKCTPQQCTVTLTIGRSTLRAIKDLRSEDVRLRFGRFKMTESAKASLVELEMQLEQASLASPDVRTQDLLMRLVRMLGEAPVGMKLDNVDLKKGEDGALRAEPFQPENMSFEHDEMTD